MQIKIGDTATWDDPDNGERLSGIVTKFICPGYWGTKLLNSSRRGKQRHVHESDILSLKSQNLKKQMELFA